MALSHPTYTDARRSTFNDIGRDQNITHNTYIILGSLPKPYQFNHSAIHDSPQPSGHEILPRPQSRLHIGTNHISDIHFAVDIAVGLIIRIARLLVDHEDPSNNRRDLKLELKLLYQTLTLTGLAIQEYNDRPLGQSLVNTIAPEVERSITVLSELLDKISGTGQGLLHTSISDLWRQVWWSRWAGDELASLKVELSHIRRLLGGFLSALNSVAWMDIGNELRTGYVSLKRFHATLAQRLPDIGHIQVQAVYVVDHLGQNIPVPFIFCSRWELGF
ncbi:hypothetical protein PILCRDRAFT_709571 [Piloderma croceum F 1598]|uniref:Fungal N-terminal domain-containing protein n=1 Tax=Piloderma croceum (strain F 1598) TaxID=765440 RepID=A0A0C3ENS8_PILCF|nr:hypothetical protein PILCRDRAFT_709571 [Piloderma croceum F 1598]